RQRRCEKKEIGGFQLYPFAIVNCALPRWVSSSILKGLSIGDGNDSKGSEQWRRQRGLEF
ncbi:unnamed protein product, partial [Linum tenue]